MLKECKYIPELETDRLILRQLSADDTEDLRKWLGKDEVYTYWGRPASKGEKNPELLFIDPRPNTRRKPTNDFLWGIELKRVHEVIGVIEIFDVENERSGMVGFRIDPQLWNEGICTEAMKRVIDFIFTETKMDRLQGNANVKNTGSNRVLEKSGFQLEGTIRHGRMVSEYCDYNIWGLIREDMMPVNRTFALFSGFPTHHFPDEIAERLQKELPVRNSLIFVSAWPDDYERNDDDSAGMHEMFTERGMGFSCFRVIDQRTEPAEAQDLIRKADCVFLMGGNATRQMRLIREKGIYDILRDCKAVILGVSAGSMNMGKTTVDIWESMAPYEGLGLTDITMIGHFSHDDTERIQLMKKVSAERSVCAMEDESAVFIKDGKVSLVGTIHRIDQGEIKPFTERDVLF